ncbi:MAG: DUF2142 domain-containing protein [Chloroflexi bacterium]|nr:DUF2142 domain-containing protein [Chloroflexota bacterium]
MGRIKNMLASPRAIYFLVALFVALGALYSVTTPLFEAGDELWHYPHVQWIARGNGLPVQDPRQKQLWEQEGGQPPLYYALAAASTFWIDTSDLQARLWRNPFAKIGVPLAYSNKNMIVHTSAENFPWQNTALAVHLIRLLSVLFSAGTVLLTYKIASELFLSLSPSLPLSISPSLALLAAAIVAFNPMFLFISASVNNDSLAALLATGALFLIVRLATRDVTNRRAFFLGIIVGFAILTKVSNIALVGVAIMVIAFLAWRRASRSETNHLATANQRESTRMFCFSSRSFAQIRGCRCQAIFATRNRLPQFLEFLRNVILFTLPVVLIAGWWFARNYFLYGDPLAFNVWLQKAGGRPPQTLLGLLDEFQGFRISFWGNFGGVNVIAPEWVYTTLDVFTLLALFGLISGIFIPKGNPPEGNPPEGNHPEGNHKGLPLPLLLWIPALHLAIVFVALIRWTLLTYASQGRLIFPAIASVGILMAYGLYELTFHASRFTLHASRFTLHVSRFTFHVSRFTLHVSSFTVFRTGSFTSHPSLRSGQAISRFTSHVSRFILHCVQDRQFHVSRIANRVSPLVLPALLVSFLFAFAVAAPFFLIAPVYAQPARWANDANVPNPVHIRFDAGGAQPELVGFQVAHSVKPGAALPITLYWRTDAPISEDLQVYIHLYDMEGNSIGQWDALPGNGLHPTRLWQPGEIFVDQYRVPVASPQTFPPLGRVEVGMARVGSPNPLAARDPEGNSITPVLTQFKIEVPWRVEDYYTRLWDFGDIFQMQFLRAEVIHQDARIPIAPSHTITQIANLAPGDVVRVHYALQARREPPADYKIFFHLLDDTGNVVAQYDGHPVNNRYPTSFWNAGEIVLDQFELVVPANVQRGAGALQLGLYNARDGARLEPQGERFDRVVPVGDHLEFERVEFRW